jgi:hypothetical protein
MYFFKGSTECIPCSMLRSSCRRFVHQQAIDPSRVLVSERFFLKDTSILRGLFDLIRNCFSSGSSTSRRSGCMSLAASKTDLVALQISSFHSKHGFQGNLSLAALEDFYSDPRIDHSPKVIQAMETLQYLLESWHHVHSSYLNLIHCARAGGARGVPDACLRAFARWAEGIPHDPAVEALHHARQMMDEAEELTPLIVRLMKGFNAESLEKAARVMLGEAEEDFGLCGKVRRKPQKVGRKGSQREPEPVSWSPTGKGAKRETSERRPGFQDPGVCLSPKAGSERRGSRKLDVQLSPGRGAGLPNNPVYKRAEISFSFEADSESSETQETESQDEVSADIDTPVASREASPERRVLGLSETDVLLLELMTDLWEFTPAEKGQEAQWEESKMTAALQTDEMVHELRDVTQQLGLEAGVGCSIFEALESRGVGIL